MAKVQQPVASAQQRILEAAEALFFRQGYQATVVNQIIEEAGVSKPTFYAHFPSKEDLCVAYLRNARRRDLGEMRARIEQEIDPVERFLVPLRVLREHLRESQYRGCRYFNMLAEVVEPEHPIVREVGVFTDEFRELVRNVAAELIASGPRFAHLDAADLADTYYVLFGGAIMVSQEYRAEWPIDTAERQIERLIR